MKPYYDDGRCVIYHGDCREVDAWLPVDVLVTDPPYGRGWRQGDTGSGRGWVSDRHDGIIGDDDTSTHLPARSGLVLWARWAQQRPHDPCFGGREPRSPHGPSTYEARRPHVRIA